MNSLSGRADYCEQHGDSLRFFLPTFKVNFFSVCVDSSKLPFISMYVDL